MMTMIATRNFLLYVLAALVFAQTTEKFVLRGVVKDVTQAVFPGASVRIEPESDGEQTSEASVLMLKTDNEGRFSAELPKGTYHVCASGAGFMTRCETVKIGDREPEQIVFPLVPAATDLDGGVVVEDTMPQKPIPYSPIGVITESHVSANVPQGKLFDEYMKRDLTAYFCKDAKDCRIEYELLRDGPTQTGISYPKYYLWMKCFTADKLKTEGAVRVAAVEQEEFDITHFLSAQDILKSPNAVGEIFPAPLVDKIIQKAGHK